MQISISCDLFYRFAQIPLVLDPGERSELQCLTFQNDGGHSFLIATNAATLAIQYLGATNDPDEIASVSIHHEEFLEHCSEMVQFGAMVTITGNAALGFMSLVSSLGNMVHNVLMPVPDDIPRWKTLFPEKLPKASRGGMYWNADVIIRLAAASTTGQLCFQEHIDNQLPVLISDIGDENWCALFMGNFLSGETTPIAKVPEWVR